MSGVQYWVTYAHKWGPGKVHKANCRWADGEIRTGRWMDADVVDRLDKEDCKSCGGRKVADEGAAGLFADGP